MVATPILISMHLKKKTDRADVYTVFFRMTHQGKSVSISLKTDVRMCDWDDKKWNLKMQHPSYQKLNMIMDQLRRNALNLHQDMLLKGRTIDVAHIKDRLTRSNSASTNSDPTFLEVFDKVINKKALLKGIGNSRATIQKYKRCRAHLVNYLKEYHKKSDIRFDQLHLEFLEDFEIYMKTKGFCEHNTTMKYIQTLKTIFRVAKARNITTSDPFIGFKISLRIVDRAYLSEDEIKRLIATPLPTAYMEVTRNMFVFACFTGLSYIDLKNLKMQNIVCENGSYWIRTKRQKTDINSNIPLLPIPLNLIKKNHPDISNANPHEPVIPVTSNQNTNLALKKIATHCNIHKDLTFHIARHTFATTITLSNGVPIESVSKMLGHKRIATTQHYAKIIDKKLEEDMKALEGRLRF